MRFRTVFAATLLAATTVIGGAAAASADDGHNGVDVQDCHSSHVSISGWGDTGAGDAQCTSSHIYDNQGSW
jgi:uncharacterized membrane protein